MGAAELMLLAVALSMDAFAVSVCKGLAMERFSLKNALTVGVWFGAFQAGMPLLGYLLGTRFQKYIVSFDHWGAFALLALIGLNMIREALSKEGEKCGCSLAFKDMLVLAVATSIDALAVGFSFALLSVDVWYPSAIIGVVAAGMTLLGMRVGGRLGRRFGRVMEVAGGLVLLAIGARILWQHLHS